MGDHETPWERSGKMPSNYAIQELSSVGDGWGRGLAVKLQTTLASPSLFLAGRNSSYRCYCCYCCYRGYRCYRCYRSLS